MNGGQALEIIRKKGQVGRARRSVGQLWQVPTFFAGLLAFIIVLATIPLRGDQTRTSFQSELADLRQKLAKGQNNTDDLVNSAESLLSYLPQFPRKAGDIHFLAGTVYFRQTSKSKPENLASNQTKTIDHLEEAMALGVSSADMPYLKYRLGLTLYRKGKEIRRAIDLMAQSVDKGADRPALGYGLLVEAYLALPKPNLEAALNASQKQLELTDDRNVEESAQARLTRSELLLRKEQRPEALKELERIGATAPRALRLKARLLQARICEEEGLWKRAIPVWNELLPEAETVPGGKARVHYALGLAYWNIDPPQQDKAVAHWEQSFALGGNEGQAAGIRLGEMRLYGPKGDVPAALAIWSKVLANVHTPNEYKIQALELSRAREILENACRYFLENQDYEPARGVAELYKKIAPPGVADERFAQAVEGMARQQMEKAKLLPPPEEVVKMEEVRGQFHKAAVAFEEAAVARKDDGQPDIYWRSAQCYLAAKDFTKAGAVLSKFVQLEKNETRLAEGYLSLAEAFAALKNKEGARLAYYRCIELPPSPFAFQARYQLALEEMENKKYDEALEILNDNLKNMGPLQDRSAHEKSLYKVAELFALRKDFHQASVNFKEALRQYPRNPGALAARNQMAQCYVELAKQANEKMLETNDQKTFAFHKKNRLNWLEQGFQTYDTLADELENKARQSSPLSQTDLGLLRNALFEAADLKFQMNDFDEALRRYENLQEKYRKQVESLFACRFIWQCVGSMTATADQRKKATIAAKEAINKAKADLEIIPAESGSFKGDGVWSKKQWEDFVGRVGELVNRPMVPPRPSVSRIEQFP